MTVPHSIRIVGLVLGATAFYGYVGQLVPQREVQPPQETVLRADMTTADMVKVGGELMAGKGLCLTCHTIRGTDAHGLVGPDLTHFASRDGLAANAYPNNTAYLAAWVTHAQSLKPHAQMPNLTAFTGDDLQALVTYLRGLK